MSGFLGRSGNKMVEVYTFADTPEGHTRARRLEGSLLESKFAVAYETAVEGTTPLLFLLATPEARPNRDARGCNLEQACEAIDPGVRGLTDRTVGFGSPRPKLSIPIWNLNL